jgi:glycosyltransferase involved in cell wall biosynthesis
MSVTVIIPAYNGERYVGKANESIPALTLAPEEILLIDDGSTDRTAQVGASFGPAVQ